MSEHTHILSVRGRPVGFVPGHFGDALVAVERGYFPVSSTGYRSLAGHFGLNRSVDPAAISADFLEALAVAQDDARRAVLHRLRRMPAASSDRLGNFISVCVDADAALAEGFFAEDAERFALWRGAYRLLCLIDADRRFQPAPSSPAWSPSACAPALSIRREMLPFIRQFAAGELPDAPEHSLFAARSYYALPPKPGGEPRFELPALTPELPLDLPPGNFADEEPDTEDTEAVPVQADDPAQMYLL